MLPSTPPTGTVYQHTYVLPCICRQEKLEAVVLYVRMRSLCFELEAWSRKLRYVSTRTVLQPLQSVPERYVLWYCVLYAHATEGTQYPYIRLRQVLQYPYRYRNSPNMNQPVTYSYTVFSFPRQKQQQHHLRAKLLRGYKED